MRNLYPYIFAIILLFCRTSFAEFPDSSDIETINNGIALTFNEEYGKAQALFRGLSEKYPDHPAGPFFIAATYQAEMKDHEDFAKESEFYENIKNALKLADKLRDNDKKNNWAYYFMGAANLYHALYDARKGKRFSPAHKGIRGKNLLEKCLDLDSANYDALAGLGSYRYWGAVKAGGLGWLPFIGGNREQGILDLEKAGDYSLFSKHLASSTLIYVYIHEKQFKRADSLAAVLYSRYPGGKSFLWARAFASFEGEQYDSALVYFDSLLQRIEKEPPSNNYNLHEIRYYRMLCFYNLERYDSALKEIDDCQGIVLRRDIRDRLKSQIKDVKKLREKIMEKLQEGK